MTTYRITHIGHRGDGVASGPVYAPMTAPGEVVTGDLLGDRLSHIRILEPSEDRVAPPCRHFRSCGGCALQHLRDEVVATWKSDVITAALAAQGIETHIRPILTSPPQSRRRATFSAMRTKKGALVGFHARAQETIIAIPDCTLISPALRQAIPLCEAMARIGASRTSRLSITLTQVRHGLDVLVTGGKPLDLSLRAALAEIAERECLTRLVWDDETLALRVPSLVSFDGIDVSIPPGAFLQATEDGEAALRGAVDEIVGPARTMVDLFSGCGTFALPLARGGEVDAFEGDGAMVEALCHGWRHAKGLKSVRSGKRDLFRNPLLANELSYDAAVIDPPRAGAEAQIDELARSDIPSIAHVSCNPQTFARDARRLMDGGYALNWIQPLDQFRWSPHIELVGAFFRK